MCSRSFVVILLLMQTLACIQAQNEETTPSPLTCAKMLCAPSTYCRTVMSCSTCRPESRCIPADNIKEGTDDLCKSRNYSEAILLENPNNSSTYSLLQCGVDADAQKCPLESECIQGQSGNASCCRGHVDLPPQTEKPGVCPSGDVSVCGGVMCQNDSGCPGAQKCCPGCGSMCTDPLCGNSVCSAGETCVDKQRPCSPGFMCIQALQPTCVPDGCVKCAYNENCNKTDSGYVCTPYQQLDQCGGCPSGQECESTATSCDQEPCLESYQCVARLDHPGRCPEIESEEMGTCGPVCTADDNCTSSEKCCPSSCGGSICTITVPVTTPSITCANIRCASGTYCRTVVSCSTCQRTYRCIPADNVQKETDILCQNENYTEAILLENPNNSSSFSLLQCGVDAGTQKCPLGSDCIQGQTGNGSCCQRRIDPPSVEKPGVCPSGNLSACGDVMCETDSECPGVQKCCSSCGKMCTNPLCGNSACSMGETCVDKQRPCPPGSMCIQALQPTCVPDGCVKCDFNEDCNKTDSGYDCIPYQQLDQCGGCSDGQICIDTLIRCIQAPCPSFECVTPNACGGCPSGQVCTYSEAKYQCTPDLDHPGTCPQLEPGAMGICGPVCSVDDNCTSGEKCCPSSCGGSACIRTLHDPCWRFSCQNGGNCTTPADAPYCICPSGFTGEYCEETVAVTSPSITCANIRCASGTYCRTVVSCSTCQRMYRCIPADNVHKETDILCQNENYTEAILLENPNNSSSFSLLQCGVDAGTQKCPLGSDCLQVQAGNGSCCQRRIDPPSIEKPGVCPSGEVSVCGGVMCVDDSGCPGGQKCCPGCGKMCTNPLCGNSTCSLGETCVDKQRPCPPGSMCKQALQPTCVPDGCVKCDFNENCNKTDSGYDCIPNQQLDQCGGCPDGKICIDTLIRCIQAPCPSFECVTPNACGGCPSGQVCTYSEAKYQCAPDLDHPGTCPELEPGAMGICGPVCSVDDNCTVSEKCCPSSCGGSACLRTVRDPCWRFGCQNGGYCMAPADTDTPRCICPSGFTGTYCEETTAVTTPSITCANMRCASGTYCRTVVACSTCKPMYRCIPADNVQKETDTLCQNGNYTEAILLENPNNSSSFSLLQCGMDAGTQKCPLGSDCIQGQAGNGSSCCQRRIDPSPTEKPGVCPSGDVSVCGGVMCQNDSGCPGAQKCCPGCGSMCTDPLCGNSVCSAGETCVSKHVPCPPRFMCLQVLRPTCVPDGCAKCAYNEDCNKTDSGYKCMPHQQLDQCGGCTDGKVCINTGIVCVKAPCPTFQCVTPNECGGCASGKVCKSIATKCEQEPCPPAYQCVQTDECGGCPEGQVCQDTGMACNTTECQRFKCLPDNDICPLRCPDNNVCEIKQKTCALVGRIMCIPIEVPTCVPIKPQFGSCPRVTWQLPPQSLYCKIEQLFFSCQDDSDCHGAMARCCSSVCGSKKCTYANRRTVNDNIMY